VTAPAPVVLYVKTGCSFCAAQREALAARGVAWREVNVSERPETIPELLKVTRGRRIVPVVVAGGRIDIAPGGGSSF
jgi:glutaredoxin 3